jgi:hypothetical protein
MADLQTLATTLLTNGPHRIEFTPRRVRALFNGIFLFDITSAKWVWEHKYFPQFWIPTSAVIPGVLTKGNAIDADASAFVATLSTAKDGRSSDRVLIFEKGPLTGLVRFEFGALGS